jgi:hypothetical protein
MKKYLKEIELASALLLIIGVVLSMVKSYAIGVWPCGIGLLMFLSVFLYKAFHWKEYERENKQYIIILLICIFLLIIQMVMAK